MFADQQLTSSEKTKKWVKTYASSTGRFREDFSTVMEKLSSLQVMTGPLGQVRKTCSKVLPKNWSSIFELSCEVLFLCKCLMIFFFIIRFYPSFMFNEEHHLNLCYLGINLKLSELDGGSWLLTSKTPKIYVTKIGDVTRNLLIDLLIDWNSLEWVVMYDERRLLYPENLGLADYPTMCCRRSEITQIRPRFCRKVWSGHLWERTGMSATPRTSSMPFPRFIFCSCWVRNSRIFRCWLSGGMVQWVGK